MTRRTLVLVLSIAVGIAAEVIGTQRLEAQPAPDPRVADLIQAGRVRVGLCLGTPITALKDPATGEVRGPGVDLARALAARLGVALHLVTYPRPGAVLEGLLTDAWDVALLGIDPARAAEADFSPPYVEADLTYLVPAGSSLRTVVEVDQPGVRIAVPRGDITDLRLSRVLQRATLVRTDTSDAARELLHTGQVQALAAPRYALLRHAAHLPGAMVLEDRFDVILTAMVVPQGHAGRLAYLSAFLAEAKASGLVQQTIERAGLRGVQVAPPGNPRAR